jgi:uncharacterized membrane protein SpoIIM required for sporulation
MSAPSAASAWMKSRAAVWNDWLLQSQRPMRRLSVEAAHQHVERYRSIARDLATARQLLPASQATAALESLYLSAHASIDVSERFSRARWLRLFRDEIPAIMRTLRPRILWLALLMFGCTFAGWWLVTAYPELITLTASTRMIDSVEHGHLWTDDILNVAPSSLLSIRILSNNIVVSLFAFCTGIFFGLGSFYIVAVNGLMLGALFAFTHRYGLDAALLKFVLAHGPVELSVMCIAGAVGTALGESLIRPTAPTRRESFQLAARQSARVLLACALLLIVCGVIEGFISPNPGIPLLSRAIVGIGYWFIMLAFLSGAMFRAAPALPPS